MNTDNVTTRFIKEEDYILIDQWWNNFGKIPPPRELLPENGLHGIIICKADKPIACTYLYLTNSKMAYCDYLISNPNYNDVDRFDILARLVTSSIEWARELGFLDIWWVTPIKAQEHVHNGVSAVNRIFIEKGENTVLNVSKGSFNIVSTYLNE